MNKRKVFIATGGFILAVAGVVAGRASAKFAGSNAYFKTAGNGCRILTNTNSGFFTTTPQSVSATIKTGASGTQRQLYKTSTCQASSVVYFHL